MVDRSEGIDPSVHPNELAHLFAGEEPEEVKDYLFVPRAGVAYAAGTGVPLLVPQYRRDGRALIVPASLRQLQPIDFAKVYVILGEYAFPAGAEIPGMAAEISKSLARSGSLRQRLTDIAVLAHLANRYEPLEDLAVEYAGFLQPDIAERLLNLLRDTDDGQKRWLLSRQGVLVALGHVLSYLEDAEPAVKPTLVGAIMLVHAASSELYHANEEADGELPLTGFPAALSMDIIQNELFHRGDDPLSLINRTYQIWTRYADRLTRVKLRKPPTELLEEATGLTLIDWLSFGFGLWLQRQQWAPGEPLWVSPDWFSQADPRARDRFLGLVASDPAELASRGDFGPPWAFLGLQRAPVIVDGGDYLVVDETYLLERVTSGLYWDVHDAEKANLGERDRLLWTQAFGEMLEMYVVDALERLAPPLLGDGTNLYREADFQAAFAGKVCDAGIDFGTDFLAVEVVSGQVQVSTRISGEVDGFVSDTDRLVIKKARQLHEITQFLLTDLKELTGARAIQHTRVVPVIVNAGTYPVNPISMEYIGRRLEEENLLQDQRLGKLCIIDISELELLEGLHETGGPPMHLVLRSWKESDLANVSLKNYLVSEYNAGRPDRIVQESDELFERMIDRLGLRDAAAE